MYFQHKKALLKVIQKGLYFIRVDYEKANF